MPRGRDGEERPEGEKERGKEGSEEEGESTSAFHKRLLSHESELEREVEVVLGGERFSSPLGYLVFSFPLLLFSRAGEI